MKKFKQLFTEAAADYKSMQKPDDEMEVKGYKPRSKGEEEFLKAHKVFKTSHPVALDHQFDGTGSKKAPSGEDHDGHHMKGESPVLTYKAFMQLGGYGQSAARSADKSQGDKAPQKVKEEVQTEESVEDIDEAFKKGMLKLKDGKTVKVDEATAKVLNNAMSQLNPNNRKRMEAEAIKDKKSFESMVKFAKMGG
jgi:hypothetical protein